MHSFLGIQTILNKKTRILRNKLMLQIPKYGFWTKAPMEMNVQGSPEAKTLEALH